jgi:hypothetical protein
MTCRPLVELLDILWFPALVWVGGFLSKDLFLGHHLFESMTANSVEPNINSLFWTNHGFHVENYVSEQIEMFRILPWARLALGQIRFGPITN